MSRTCRCKECGKEYKFVNGGRASMCGPCEYERWRVRKLTYKYDITEDQYYKMYADQAGCCAICGIHETKTEKRLCVDHCHDTGKVRGLLCHKCNTSIAQFEREPERLLKAYDYLAGGDSN